MPHALIFGLGYTATRFAQALVTKGWWVTATRQTVRPEPGMTVLAFDDPALEDILMKADAILSSIPPEKGTRKPPDPVLRHYGKILAFCPARWIGYLSSTGVYGDTKGRLVDETAPLGKGRRTARIKADLAWQALAKTSEAPIHIFRLPGIYGPGRSAITRVRAGTAQRVDVPGHVFGRIHVADIVTTLMASLEQPAPKGEAAIYNVADDLPASGAAVIEYACNILGKPHPPLVSLQEANLSDEARRFYSESRRVDNTKIKRDLGIALRYPTYREGLIGCLAEERE